MANMLAPGFLLEQFSLCLGRQGVADMGEPCFRIVAGNGLDGEADGFLERLLGAGTEPAQDSLDLGKRLLDRREVGRVGRQEEQLAVVRFQGLANTGRLVDAQII